MANWKQDKMIQKEWITQGVTPATISFAKDFGSYLGKEEFVQGKKVRKLTTNQLRKFFGEIKRQEMRGFQQSEFILLKPKLAYAVGRDKNNTKIDDFYNVITAAMDYVTEQKSFKNFIQVFEAIVAYHKVAEEGRL